jgi:hypothetical protein
MSLINQMLRNLEHRNASAEKIESITSAVQVMPVVEHVGFNNSRLLYILLCLGVFIIGIALWMSVSNKPDKQPLIAKAPEVLLAPVDAISLQKQPETTSEIDTKNTFTATTPVEVLKQHKARVNKTSEVAVQTQGLYFETGLSSAIEGSTLANQQVGEQIKSPGKYSTSSTTKTVTPYQQSENHYRQAVNLLQQGRVVETLEELHKSLAADSGNIKARQMLISLLLENKRSDEALELLQDGVKRYPQNIDFIKTLARLKVDSGDDAGARDILEAGLIYSGQDAEYHAFYASLLQRNSQHDKAIEHYVIALQTSPSMPAWLVGVGISLQAVNKFHDASSAFRRAQDTGQLNPQLSQFVEQRLNQLKSAN